MANSWLLDRTAELFATYIIHSALLLVSAIGAGRLARFPDHSHVRVISPKVAEWLWKMAAVLPLITSALCLCGGWSRPLFEWSISASDRSQTAVAVQDHVDCASLVGESGRRAFPGDQLSIDLPIPSKVAGETPMDGQSLPSTESVVPQISNRSMAAAESIIDSDAGPIAVVEAPAPSMIGTESPSFESTSIDASGSENAASWVATLATSVLLWMALCVLRLGLQCIRMRRFISTCMPVTGALQDYLQHFVPAGQSIRLVRATCSPARSIEPFACGLFEWTIVLPDRLEQQMPPDELRALLGHEVAHLIRRDPWWQCIGEVLCTALIFQPLNLLARRQWQEATEFLCDDWAVRQNVSATSLAACLTRIAEWRLNQRAGSLGLAAAGQAGSLLRRRVELLLQVDRPLPPRSSTTGIGLAAGFVLGLLVGSFGPRLTLTPPIEAAINTQESSSGENQTATARAEIFFELRQALDELDEAQSLLKSVDDPAIAALLERLEIRAQSLRMKVQP